VKGERAAIDAAESAFESAKAQGDEAGLKFANATRAEHAQTVKKLMDFKSGLTRLSVSRLQPAQRPIAINSHVCRPTQFRRPR
jgi:hypothetical protein